MTRNTELLSIEKVRVLAATMPVGLYFVDMAETVYEGLCALTGDWGTGTGPDLIARLPESEDGSDPRWKLLEHTPALIRLTASLLAARERAEGVLTRWETEALTKMDGDDDLEAIIAPDLISRAHQLRAALTLDERPAPAIDLAEENRLMYAAINRMAWRMDKRAEDAEKAGAVHIAKLYRACADIVTEELKGAAEVQS